MKPATRGLVAAAIVFLSATAAAAAADPALTCESGKLKTTGKYASCRLSAESKAVKANASPDYSKCDSKFSSSWGKEETKAGMGVCPSEGDETDIGERTTNYANGMADLLSGGVAVDRYAPATGQTTSYGAGSDGAVQAGAALSYKDNGDGTITDRNTGLMWEKKVGDPLSYTGCSNETGNCANPHHVGNYYTWSAASTAFDGQAVSIFLNQLNNRCDNDTTVSCTVDTDCAVPGGACGFAGHRDWRLPNIKELVGIVDYNLPYPGPTVDAAFQGASCGAVCTDITDPACSCTQSDLYWSSSTYQGNPSGAWIVDFSEGTMYADFKTSNYFVRAVRAGS